MYAEISNVNTQVTLIDLWHTSTRDLRKTKHAHTISHLTQLTNTYGLLNMIAAPLHKTVVRGRGMMNAMRIRQDQMGIWANRLGGRVFIVSKGHLAVTGLCLQKRTGIKSGAKLLDRGSNSFACWIIHSTWVKFPQCTNCAERARQGSRWIHTGWAYGHGVQEALGQVACNGGLMLVYEHHDFWTEI